jgi:hypothetical protein
MHMLINGKYTCSSNAMYGFRGDEAMGGMGGKGHAPTTAKGSKSAKGAKSVPGQKILTVSNMTDCVGPFKVKKGEYVQLRAEYDLKKHPLYV